MELRHLTTFRVVATRLSFTRAAEALDYAQSSVTAQIQTLEEELGVALFERLGKRVLLTDAGLRLLAYAEKVLGLVDEARVAVVSDAAPQGTLTIGAPESLCAYRLPPVLQQYRARFPRVHLVFRPCPAADLYQALHGGAMDMAFLLEDVLPVGSLVGERLVPEPLLVLAHPCHPLAQQAHVGPRDLDGESLLLTEAGCSYRVPFERTLADAGTQPGAILEFASIEAIKQCVMAGMGVTILPVIAVAAEVAQRRLTPLQWVAPGHSVATHMVWHKDKWLSPALRAFLSLSRDVLASEDRQVLATGYGGTAEK